MAVPRRVVLVLTVLLALVGVPLAGTAQSAPATGPLALVYRGPASVPGTAESVAVVLRNSPSKFRVEYVGPKDTPITAATLARATVFAQPGGPSLKTAWKAMKPYAGLIRDWVAGGGNYLGFCVGGYLAGATPGYDLLPGDTSQYSAKRGATVWNTEAARSTITWRGTEYTTYFQDPPAFNLDPGNTATVLGTYRGGEVAALAVDYGKGRVGVTGPHIEADASWFVDDGLSADGAVHPQLAYDLIETTVKGNRSAAAAATPVPTTATPVPATATPVPATAPPSTPPLPAPAPPPVVASAPADATPTAAPAPAVPSPVVSTPPAPVVPSPVSTPPPAPRSPVPGAAAPLPSGPPPSARPETRLPWPLDRLAELPFVRQFLAGATGLTQARPL